MAGSLKDQLLKAGLTDEKKARQMDKDKRKQAKVAKSSGLEVVDENKEAARKAAAEEAANAPAVEEEAPAEEAKA